MRPLHLELRGFTSFRDPQAIDFSKLDLFAIAGPTGAGKSSILDAITYALYGKVERVGNQCAQLISQGLPAMAVSLEFSCGADRFRVARRTARKPPTTVVLERLDGGDWRSEAGKVHEVGERIVRIVGLDYDGFTRAVLLPQGKFDQFLAGDAGVRRRLLTELLGLELFERMSKIANSRAKEGDVARKTKDQFLVSHYAQVTEEAADAQRRAAADARAREERLEAALKKVGAIEARWEAVRQLAEDLRGLAGDAAALARDAMASSDKLEGLQLEAVAARRALKEATSAAVAAKKREERARAEHAKAVDKLGTAEDLRSARAKAEQLETAREQSRDATSRLEEAVADEPEQRAGAARAAAEAKNGEDAAARAKADLDATRAALERLQHDDQLAAVAQGLRSGDPCPICGTPLRRVPPSPPGAAAMKTSAARVATSQKLLDAAQGRYAKLLVAANQAANAAKRAADDVKRGREDVKTADALVGSLEKAVSGVLGPELPPAPVAVLEERIERVGTLRADADAAGQALHAAEMAHAKAEIALERISGAIAKESATIPLKQTKHLLEQVAKRLPEQVLPRVPIDMALEQDASRLAERTLAISAALSEYGGALRRVSDQRLASEPELLLEASRVTDGLVPPAGSLDALASAVHQAAKAATTDAVTAETKAHDLAGALVQKEALIGEIAELNRRVVLLHGLALDLRQDAIVDFLQAQALMGLAREGGARLRELSDNRYDLRHRDDEFYVADLWNGEEERSVKTLSGGETFLASLALALSLAGQVSALSSGPRATLDSLFLDEGFGSLDRAAVNLVIEGLERLGSDGRMVGIITHVREITDRLPRIEVHKSSTGSRVEVVP